MRLLMRHATEFWDAVAKGTAIIEGQDLDVSGVIIHVQEANAQRIRYRRSGSNEVVAFDEMHPSMARAIARKWLDEIPSSHLFIGAFMVVEPEYTADRARAELELAMATGPPASEIVRDLMLVLDELK